MRHTAPQSFRKLASLAIFPSNPSLIRTISGIGVVLFALLGSAPASADGTGSLVLRGHMPLQCEIAVAPTQAAENLDLTRDQNGLVVASVRETCNSGSGYRVSVSSKSNGSLEGEMGDGSYGIPYELSYNATAADLSSSHASAVMVKDATSPTNSAGVRNSVAISYRAKSDVPGGDYSDTLTFTITAR